MNKQNVTIVKVNLQQGLILNNGEVVAAYSLWSEKVYIKVPWRLKEIQLPDEIANLEVIEGTTDGFHIEMWTIEGYKDLHDLENQSDENLKAELKRRGYCTDAIWHTNDVQKAIDAINEDDDTNYTLEDVDPMAVLESLFGHDVDFSGENEHLLQTVREHLNDYES